MQVSLATAEPTQGLISAPMSAPQPPQQTCRSSAVATPDEAVARADTFLSEEQWSWVRELLETVKDTKMRCAAKLFFLDLLEATTADTIEAVLSDLNTWRANIDSATKSARAKSSRQLKEVSRTLFLLGADKQLDLMRSAVSEPIQP